MKKPKIVITVEGGIVQNITTNCEVEIIVIDFDRQSEEETFVTGILEPDTIFKEDKYWKSLDEDCEVFEEIKKLDF